jgi:hypothetical protein
MMAGLLVLLPLLLLQGSGADVANDPGLQKKINVAVKAESINDALREIGKEAGVQTVAVQNIWPLKVTVFAKNEPVGPLMDRIADVLDCEWTKDGDVYRLGYERLSQQQRQAYEQAEQRAAREELDAELLAYTRLAAVNPNAPKADLSKLSPEERKQIERLAQDPAAFAFGRMLRELSGAAGAGFWRGEVRTFVLPPSAAQTRPPQEGAPLAANESSRLFARYDPFLISLERNPARGEGSIERNSLVLYRQPPATLAELPFAKAVLAWPGSGQSIEDDPRFSRSVPGIEENKTDYFLPKPTLDDGAEVFHKATGISVVTDSFSVPSAGLNQGMSAEVWLASLSRKKAQGNVKHGIVGVRHEGFWRLRLFEPSPGTIRSYEKLAEREPLTLDQYASLAGAIRGAPVSALMHPDAVVLPFDAAPLSRLMPVLVFYNSLTAAQRRQARSILEVGTLNDAQKRLYVEAVLWGGLKGRGSAPNLVNLLRGDFTEQNIIVAEESFGSGVKDKQGKELAGRRKFYMYLGPRFAPVMFDSEVKGRQPKPEGALSVQ